MATIWKYKKGGKSYFSGFLVESSVDNTVSSLTKLLVSLVTAFALGDRLLGLLQAEFFLSVQHGEVRNINVTVE